jgi:hypothetical protein
MFRSIFSAALVFASLIVIAFAAPTQASDVSDHPSDDTIVVPTFIPGFDDVDPESICSPSSTPNLIGFAGCGGTLRLLPWNMIPSPPQTERIRFLSPAT